MAPNCNQCTLWLPRSKKFFAHAKLGDSHQHDSKPSASAQNSMAKVQIPASIPFEGSDLPMWTYGQLEQLGRAQLKQRALNLRDVVGADRLPPMQTSASLETTIMWIISVQVALMASGGTPCKPVDFGLPSGFGQQEVSYFGGKNSNQAPAGMDLPDSNGNPELVSAYSEAQRGAEAAKQRNRGQALW